MTPKNQLTIDGNFHEHPFAEVVAEISHARITGSLRLTNNDRKVVIYFKNGRVLFAVSNSRSSRLFDILLKRGRVTSEELANIPNFTSDLDLANFFEGAGFIDRQERTQLFVDQIEAIFVDALSWKYGAWTFSSLARLRDGLEFDVDTSTLLCEYGRCLPSETVVNRFRRVSESFARSDTPNLRLAPSHDEMAILAMFLTHPMTLEEILSASPLPDGATMGSIYTLWLAGLLVRQNWNPAFTDMSIEMIRQAKLELKVDVQFRTTAPIAPKAEEPQVSTPVPVKPQLPEVSISLDEYLERVEKAETYYDVLGVEVNSTHAQIRHAYFGLAKLFHPDHYHKERGEIKRRVDDAFAELSKGHETLKTPESRDLYDFKIRSEIAQRKKQGEAGTYDERSRQLQQAIDSFERGFSLLMENEIESALPFLARAAHFDPKNARFHAYYGKALSFDKKQSHKAENEMQTALRLDPQNPTFRIMLAEFFIQMNLVKRAEGELNRLLTVFPSNREARDLLAQLKQ